MHYAIEIRNLYKSYGDFSVLKGIDLQVESGTVFALLGPNGAGKTTMLRIITTLLKPDSGTILIDGIDLIANPNKIKKLIGIVGQYTSIDGQLTGRENLRMIGRLHKLSAQEADNTAQRLLDKFELLNASDRITNEYSGGMRRRLDLAASLVAQPKILFLDEPTTGLDPQSREILWDIIVNEAKRGATVFLTTQYLEEADKIAHKIAIINHGKIIACDTARTLKSQIGEESLNVTLGAEVDIHKVQTYFAHMTVHVDHESHALNFPISNDMAGIHRLKNIIDLFIQHNILIKHYDVHKPTLDEVFISLVNRK